MTKSLTEKDSAYVWHPYSALEGGLETIVVKSAKGVYLYTEDGREILDAISSWWVNIHGHAHPYMIEKLIDQVTKMEHVIFAGFTHEPAITLAERLLKILPGDQRKLFFSDNGSTAVEAAIKLAIQYKVNRGEKPGKIVALEGAFHGDTFGAMSVSERGLFTNPFTKYLFEVAHLPFPEEGKERDTVVAFEKLVKQEILTAFIYEPLIQGAAGMRIYSAEVLEELLRIAKANKVLCIADEVMTGFGRTGKLFASDYMDTKPDIICLSKAITGGFMAFGATSCNAEVESAFMSSNTEKTFFHGHSYTGNPMACALANASLDLLLTEDYGKRIEFIRKSHIAFLTKIKDIRGIKRAKVLGTVLVVEIDTMEETGYTNKLRNELYNFFLTKNILMRPLGNVIYILPPYIIEEKELDFLYNSIVDLFKTRSN